jgi:hypothetical protein
MRNRLEDLGRLMVMLEEIEASKLFEDVSYQNDFVSHYFPADEMNKSENEIYIERLSDLRMAIDFVSDKLSECIVIARGHDDLNDP